MVRKNRNPHLPPIVHLGAEHEVTGSCHLLQTNGLNILVDCGLPQGRDKTRPIENWPVRPSDIDYVFITHAHIDHIGRLPFLIKLGFKGEILTTHPTKQLIIPMLEDAMGFPEMQVDQTEELIQILDQLTWGFEFGQTFDLKNGIRFSFKRAGHILGSCFIRLENSDPRWSVIFSGDLGAGHQPLIVDPEPPDPCDLLVLESTYGDTVHEARNQRVERLGAVLERAVADGGKVFIPAFALGRTQMLIHDLHRLGTDRDLRDKFPNLDIGSKLPVFLDSPLGKEVTETYRRLADFWDSQARDALQSGENPLDFEKLYATASTRSHDELLRIPGPHIILAGSGMCTGGRIIDHLKFGLEDPRNDIVFIGYQAEGTTGRAIIQQGNRPDAAVQLEDQCYAIRAKVHSISGYSAHADQREIVAWVSAMPEKPGSIKLVHGEPAAQQSLADHLRSKGFVVEND
ncbi:MAG: MBL fold metallo-hydrolase [Desulfobacteraceae bacterium]|nr:MAG: MBL fold metallo-hydrolase [Desulfobacteraceae bacterium]